MSHGVSVSSCVQLRSTYDAIKSLTSLKSDDDVQRVKPRRVKLSSAGGVLSTQEMLYVMHQYLGLHSCPWDLYWQKWLQRLSTSQLRHSGSRAPPNK